jgi:deazaflavin-dependent oxidoreductase (nitroreductase family)
MPLPDKLRSINKHFTNRLIGKIARSAWGPFSIIYHTGRRSGKPYETPIVAMPASAGFVVALTYGSHVDWYQNIKAAGRCKILRRGNEYAIEKVETLDAESALPYFPVWARLILRAIRVQHNVGLSYLTNEHLAKFDSKD